MRKLVYKCNECEFIFVAYDGAPLLHTKITGHTDIEVVKGAVILEGDMSLDALLEKLDV